MTHGAENLLERNSKFLEASASDRSFLERNLQPFIIAFDALSLIAAYFLAVYVYQFAALFIPLAMAEDTGLFFESSRQVSYITLSIGVIILLYAHGQYTRRVPWWSQMLVITKLCFGALVLEGFYSFAFELDFSRFFILLCWGFALLTLTLNRLIVDCVKKKSAAWKQPTVIIAHASSAKNTLYALASDPGIGFEPHTILLRGPCELTYETGDLPEKYEDIRIIDSEFGYEEFITNNPENFYIISLDTFRGEKKDKIIDILNRCNIDYALVPATSSVSLSNIDTMHFFGNDVMLLRPRKTPSIHPVASVVKRSIDIVGASVALLIFGIPILIMAALLKLEGQSGSPFYGGVRVGQNGRPFKCWKLRTMEPNTDHLLQQYLDSNPQAKADWEKYCKLDNDPRVQTITAKLLRKASLDELPQLWNILTGDMSLVGPRPILRREISNYGDAISGYKSVKPGITGLWQVSGRNNVSFKRRVLWDGWYIRNWTLWGDIVIILKTIRVVISRAGAN